MNKKIILTSVLVSFIVGPAMAVDFPTDQYMQKNTTYDNSATSTNMGISSGSTTAEAWYDIEPGFYLPKNSYEATPCPANSFCAGASGVKYSTTSDQVISSCPTGWKSDAYAAKQGDCYAECPVSSVAHAQTVSGIQAYTGTSPSTDGSHDTCSAEACVSGYHTETGTAPTLAYSGANSTLSACKGADGSDCGRYTWSAGLDMISSPNSFIVRTSGASADTSGHARCSNLAGAATSSNGYKDISGVATFETLDGTSSGQYCYCRFEKDETNNKPLNARWVFLQNMTSATSCESSCALACSEALLASGTNSSFKTAMQNSGMGLNSCSGNVITINYDENGGNAIANGSCTYDGNLVLPAAPTRAGYAFSGWKLNGQTTLQNAGATISKGCTNTNIGTYSGTSTKIVAQWSANAITIKWTGVKTAQTGATLVDGVATTTLNYGDNIVTPKEPLAAPAGQKFLGWKFTRTND